MKKLFSIMLILLLLSTLIIPTCVKAYSFTFVATPNKTELNAGEEIEITLGIANIDVGEDGMNTLETTFTYDTEVFEEVTQDSFTSKNNWTILYNNDDTEYRGKIIAIILTGGVTQDKTIGTVKLKAKDNITDKETATIKFSNITTNNGTDLIHDTEKQIDVRIRKIVSATYDIDEDEGIIGGVTPATTVEEFKEQFNIGSENIKIYDQDGNEVTEGPLATGMYVTFDDKDKNYYICIKGDINGDGRINQIDLTALIRHVIRLRNCIITDSVKLQAADVSSDETVDQRDVTVFINYLLKGRFR